MPQVRREDRKGHASCVSGEVCANSVISKIKKLKKTLDTAGVVRDGRLCRQPFHYKIREELPVIQEESAR